MLNKQLPEKKDLREDGVLLIHSIFYTIQGEGPFAGHPAIFVRLAGCNLQCPMCDTDYTSTRFALSPSALVNEFDTFERRRALVVITGGEPFRQTLFMAVHALLAAGYRVQIETNGTLYQDLPYDRITVVCSPKTGSVNANLLPYIKAFKYVVSHDSVAEDDLLPLTALGHSATPRLFREPKEHLNGMPRPRKTIYIQPADHGNSEDNAKSMDAAIRAVLVHGYTLCLQIHKIIGVA